MGRHRTRRRRDRPTSKRRGPATATSPASILNAYYTDPTSSRRCGRGSNASGVDRRRRVRARLRTRDWIDAAPTGVTSTRSTSTRSRCASPALLTGQQRGRGPASRTGTSAERSLDGPTTAATTSWSATCRSRSHRPGRNNPHRDSLHNLAVARSVSMLRPGGVAAVLTSRFSLDASDHAHWRQRLATQSTWSLRSGCRRAHIARPAPTSSPTC